MKQLNRIIKYLLYILLLSPFLAYVYTVWLKLPKTITSFFTFVVFAFGFVYVFNKKNIVIPLFAKYLLAFALYKIAWRFLLETNKYFLTEIYYYIYDFAILFIVIIIYNFRFSDKFIERCVLIMKITVTLAAVASIMQVFDMRFLDASQYFRENNVSENIYQFRRSSIFGFIEPLALGLAFIPLLSVLIGYMLCSKQKRYILFLIMGGIVAFLSNTRFIMVGFVLLTIQVLIFNRVQIGRVLKYIIVLGIGVILIITILHYLGYNFQDWYNQRLLAEGNIQGTTRYKAIGNFIIFFPQKPIFGFGEMTKEIVTASEAVGSSHIHVGYLSHLVMYGIVGCFFLFSYWFLLTKTLYRTAKFTNYWGSFFAFLTFLWSFATMSQSSIFYYGLIFAMVFDKYFFDKGYIEFLKTGSKNLNSYSIPAKLSN